MTTSILNTKDSEVENRISNHDEYIITLKFNILTSETFTARLKQGNLATKLILIKKTNQL